MCPLIDKLKENIFFEVRLCVTGQHLEMLNQVLEVFDVVPDFNLKIMSSRQTLSKITASVLLGLDDVFNKYTPDLVLVHGDTSTTLSTALSCFYHGLAVAHIEAGLRTRNIQDPFPEELNRQVVSKLSCLHFAPTEECAENLRSEGISKSSIFVTGNTVIDALHLTLKNIQSNDQGLHQVEQGLLNILGGYDFRHGVYVLITVHRRENIGERASEIFEAISALAKSYKKIHFIFPVHLNPAIREPATDTLGHLDNVHLIEPLEYHQFVYLMSKSFFVISDSGGIQEEAPSLGKPVLLCRDTSERPEALSAGTVKLVGSDRESIVSNAKKLIEDDVYYEAMSVATNPYGDGRACDKIIAALKSFFLFKREVEL